MTTAMKVLLRVVKRRVANGEAPETVLADYPKLSEDEKAEIREGLEGW